MIDEKKLLCAFIYSAYDSEYCGACLGQETKKTHMKLYQGHIKENNEFPKKEIDETQAKMMNEAESSGIRDYIYGGHLIVIKSRIEKELELEFKDAVKTTAIIPASNCPINYYEVLEKISASKIGVRNLISGKAKTLEIMAGLETPRIGDFVSGHWGHMLEVVTDWQDLDKYMKKAKQYFAQFQ